MKSKRISVWLVVALGLLVTSMIAVQKIGSAADDGGVQRWEHLAFTVDAQHGVGGAETSRQIVQLGSDGWQLVDVESFVKDGETTKLAYFFKRPK